MKQNLCFFLCLLLALVGYAPSTRALECEGETPSLAAAVEDPVDFLAINHALHLADDHQRLDALDQQLKRLDAMSAHPLRLALEGKLRLAQAHSALRLGAPARAIASLRAMPADTPDAGAAMLLLAEAYSRQGQPKQALAWLHHTAELQADRRLATQALLQAGQLYHELGSQTQALAHYQAAADQSLLALEEIQVLRPLLQTPAQWMQTVETPGPLQRYARKALTSLTFGQAQSSQIRLEQQLPCLTRALHQNQQAVHSSQLVMQDLPHSLHALRAQQDRLRTEQEALAQTYTNQAHALSPSCAEANTDCLRRHEHWLAMGRELVRLRNRLISLEARAKTLQTAQARLPGIVNATVYRSEQILEGLLRENKENRELMQTQLQESLLEETDGWRQLAAQAHYRMGLLQEAAVRRKPEAPGASIN